MEYTASIFTLVKVASIQKLASGVRIFVIHLYFRFQVYFGTYAKQIAMEKDFNVSE